MKILSHRGYWKLATEKNSIEAFTRSFQLKFGTETDVRDLNGILVISHDMPTGVQITLNEFLTHVDDSKLPLAINIKSDGLAAHLAHAFKSRGLDWFAFDMSIPDMRAHLNVGNPVFARMSEVEKHPAWIDEVSGIWLDGFSDTWFNADTIKSLLDRNLRVCVVSPELHGRQHDELWSMLRCFKCEERLMLCTDLPEDAQSFFNIII